MVWLVYTFTKKKYNFVASTIFCYVFEQTIYEENNEHKTGVINDPLGQIYSHASSYLCFLLFCFALEIPSFAKFEE